MFLFMSFVVGVTTVGALASRNDEILTSSSSQTKDGYHFGYKTSGEQEREERGVLEAIDGNLILRIKGFYSYRGSDERLHKVFYRADESGYRAEGDTIPELKTGFSKELSWSTENNANEVPSGKTSILEETKLELSSPTTIMVPESDRDTTTEKIPSSTPDINDLFENFAPVPIISSAAIGSLVGGGLG